MHPVCGSNRKQPVLCFFFVWSKVKINEHVDALGTSTAQHQAMASHSPTHPRFAKARAPKKIFHIKKKFQLHVAAPRCALSKRRQVIGRTVQSTQPGSTRTRSSTSMANRVKTTKRIRDGISGRFLKK